MSTTVSTDTGLSDPTLAYGLTSITDWSTAMPFLDLMKMSRPMLAHSKTEWSFMDTDALVAGGYLDEDGWPTSLPEGATSIGTIWSWSSADTVAAQSRIGVYVLRYEGTATLQMKGDVQIISSTAGEIVFRNLTGASMWLNISNISSTDPVTDITLVREEYVDLFDMGEIFNPDWLDIVQDARVLRFMDWMNTNDTTYADWESRSTVDDVSYYSDGGVPVEIMVELANQVGADPWFTIPAGATEEYIRNFATYVRDHLKAGLVAHVEYSNEIWNGSFDQTTWLVAQATANWGLSDTTARMNYGVMLPTQCAQIWEEVFGTEADVRLDNVLGTMTANSTVASRMLAATIWKAMDPDGWVAPSSVFDSLAVTTYFGGAVLTTSSIRTELLALIQSDPEAAADWLTTKMLDPTFSTSIPQIVAYWNANNLVATAYGLDLVAYEGGQHLLQAIYSAALTSEEKLLLQDFMTDYIRSEDMVILYQTLWTAWTLVSDGPFMQFGEVGAASKYGAWGLFSALEDDNPRADLLETLNAAQESWFGSGGGSQYEQGTVDIAGDGGETLIGTNLDDVLIGGDGNDLLVVGTGMDVVSGGGGRDVVLLSVLREEISVTRDGTLLHVTGGGHDLMMRSVELLKFSDGSSAFIDALLDPIALPTAISTASALLRVAVAEAETGKIVTLKGSAGVTVEGIEASSAIGQELGDLSAYRTGGGSVTTLAEAQAQGAVMTGVAALVLTNGHDSFTGLESADAVWGRLGRDTLMGLGGDDTLDGGNGADRLIGGAGDDLMRGGAGVDTFVFALGDGNDRILDVAAHDRLDLSALEMTREEILSHATTDDDGWLVLDFGTLTVTLEGLVEGDTSWLRILV